MIKFVRGRRSSRCRCRLEESQIRPDRYCCECEPGETRANLYDEITVKITAELGAGEVARKLREVIAARHCEVVARWREPGGYPLDLYRLIPIPEDVLALWSGRAGSNSPGQANLTKHQEQERPQSLWWYAMFLVLLAVLAESFVAGRYLATQRDESP